MAETVAAIAGPDARLLAAGDGWSVRTFRCTAGPDDRPFEEQHDGFSVAAVVEGSFDYHGENGWSALMPGSLLLGNAGACYACGHSHGRGDRCIALNVSAELFGELSASGAGTSRFRFPSGMAVAAGAALPAFMRLLLWPSLRMDDTGDERAITILESTIAHVSGLPPRRQTVSASDVARVRDGVAMIERAPEAAHSLGNLAAAAGMSRYHFLRVFRRVAGVTPYQCVLAARLRRAAHVLAATDEPVTQAAFAAGFGDLSTFNRRFRKAFGMTPVQWRQGH